MLKMIYFDKKYNFQHILKSMSDKTFSINIVILSHNEFQKNIFGLKQHSKYFFQPFFVLQQPDKKLHCIENVPECRKKNN